MDTKKSVILLILLSVLGFRGLGQQTWIDAEFSGKIIKRLELSFVPEARFENPFELKEYFVSTGLEYKLHDYLSLGGSYRIGEKIKNNGSSETVSRFAFDAKTQYEWKNLEAQFRARYANTDDFGDEESSAIQYFRYRLKLDYSLKKFGLSPYLSYEIFRDLEEKEFTKARYDAGVVYSISKSHKIGIYYRRSDYIDSEKFINILGVSYRYKFPGKTKATPAEKSPDQK